MILILVIIVFFGTLAFNYRKSLQAVTEENTKLHMEIAGLQQDIENLQIINRNMNDKLFI